MHVEDINGPEKKRTLPFQIQSVDQATRGLFEIRIEGFNAYIAYRASAPAFFLRGKSIAEVAEAGERALALYKESKM